MCQLSCVFCMSCARLKVWPVPAMDIENLMGYCFVPVVFRHSFNTPTVLRGDSSLWMPICYSGNPLWGIDVIIHCNAFCESLQVLNFYTNIPSTKLNHGMPHILVPLSALSQQALFCCKACGEPCVKLGFSVHCHFNSLDIVEWNPQNGHGSLFWWWIYKLHWEIFGE